MDASFDLISKPPTKIFIKPDVLILSNTSKISTRDPPHVASFLDSIGPNSAQTPPLPSEPVKAVPNFILKSRRYDLGDISTGSELLSSSSSSMDYMADDVFLAPSLSLNSQSPRSEALTRTESIRSGETSASYAFSNFSSHEDKADQSLGVNAASGIVVLRGLKQWSNARKRTLTVDLIGRLSLDTVEARKLESTVASSAFEDRAGKHHPWRFISGLVSSRKDSRSAKTNFWPSANRKANLPKMIHIRLFKGPTCHFSLSEVDSDQAVLPYCISLPNDLLPSLHTQEVDISYSIRAIFAVDGVRTCMQEIPVLLSYSPLAYLYKDRFGLVRQRQPNEDEDDEMIVQDTARKSSIPTLPPLIETQAIDNHVPDHEDGDVSITDILESLLISSSSVSKLKSPDPGPAGSPMQKSNSTTHSSQRISHGRSCETVWKKGVSDKGIFTYRVTMPSHICLDVTMNDQIYPQSHTQKDTVTFLTELYLSDKNMICSIEGAETMILEHRSYHLGSESKQKRSDTVLRTQHPTTSVIRYPIQKKSVSGALEKGDLTIMTFQFGVLPNVLPDTEQGFLQVHHSLHLTLNIIHTQGNCVVDTIQIPVRVVPKHGFMSLYQAKKSSSLSS